MKLEDLEIYNLSMDLSDRIWAAIGRWDYFAKDTIGKQWCRAADSVSANISEGFGRNSYRDARSFYYIARGSLYESKTWLDKSMRRELISETFHEDLLAAHNVLGIKLNRFINVQTRLIEKAK